MQNKIEEAAKQAEELKRNLYKSKQISLPNKGGDVFHTQEVMRYINGIEDVLTKLSDASKEEPKGLEELRELFDDALNGDERFFEDENNKLDSYKIADWFWKKLSGVSNTKSSDAVEFAKFLDHHSQIDGSPINTMLYEQSYTEFLKPKGK